MLISADNKTRACQWLPEKIFNLSPSAHAFRISPLAGGPRLRPDLHHQIIHIHLQESKTIRRNPGYSNPLSQHWDHIITTSITRRTVQPWLVMMMTSRDTGFNGMGASSLSFSPTLLCLITWPATVKLAGDSPVRDSAA